MLTSPQLSRNPLHRRPKMAALPAGPVIGFVGLIESWIDLALIDAIAGQRPGWQIVLIGKSNVDVSSLKRHDNIHLLGRKPYAELPRYLKAFTVGVIPFVPTSSRSTSIPSSCASISAPASRWFSSDIRRFAATPTTETASSPRITTNSCAPLDQAVESDTIRARQLRSQTMQRESWEQKVAELGDHVMRVRIKKGLALKTT